MHDTSGQQDVTGCHPNDHDDPHTESHVRAQAGEEFGSSHLLDAGPLLVSWHLLGVVVNAIAWRSGRAPREQALSALSVVFDGLREVIIVQLNLLMGCLCWFGVPASEKRSFVTDLSMGFI